LRDTDIVKTGAIVPVRQRRDKQSAQSQRAMQALAERKICRIPVCRRKERKMLKNN
tara:strand:+ start:95 stop:262 length:168 start_codon:yes stop_codon:yes gene_type:complete